MRQRAIPKSQKTKRAKKKPARGPIMLKLLPLIINEFFVIVKVLPIMIGKYVLTMAISEQLGNNNKNIDTLHIRIYYTTTIPKCLGMSTPTSYLCLQGSTFACMFGCNFPCKGPCGCATSGARTIGSFWGAFGGCKGASTFPCSFEGCRRE